MNYDYQYHGNSYNNPTNYNDERLVGGGFVFPFLLGGVTGAALAPNFWNRPNYGYPPYPYYPYNPYPPRRWF